MKVKRGVRGALGGWWGLMLVFALAVAPAYAASLRPLELDEAVNLAVERSEAVVAAEREVRSARIALEGARGAYGTDVTLGAGVRQNETGRAKADASVRADGSLGASLSWTASAYTSPPSSDTTGNAVSVTYQLWPPPTDGREWAAIGGAEHNLAEAEVALERAKAQAGLTALELYSSLQLSIERVRLAEGIVEEAQIKLEQVQESVAAGRASVSDRINQEIELLKQLESLGSRQAQVQSLQRRLAQLIGHDPDQVVLPALESSPMIAARGELVGLPGVEEAVRAAIAASADVRAKARALQDAQLAVAAARRASGVNLSLNGRVAQDLGGDIDWSIGVSGSYALSDSGRRRRALESAELSLERAQSAYDTAVRSVKQATDDALRSIEEATRSLEIAAAVEELRRLDVSVAEQQAARGILSDAELAARRRSLKAAIVDRMAAELALTLEQSRFELLIGRTPEVT